ncbi:MAG: hypothetical protein K8E66_03360 [Phycisphaerales bacterium]|nr:hypothetical protein [Phycisphaerales bacterium]
MRSVFDRPNRRDRRIEEIVALCASRSSFAGGYTAAEHACALDGLLADLGVVDSPEIESHEGAPFNPEIVVKQFGEPDEDDSRLFLAATC